MTDANGVNVRERAHELVHVQFDLQHWHRLLEFDIVPRRAVNGLGHIFQNKVQVDLVFLFSDADKIRRETKLIVRLRRKETMKQCRKPRTLSPFE